MAFGRCGQAPASGVTPTKAQTLDPTFSMDFGPRETSSTYTPGVRCSGTSSLLDREVDGQRRSWDLGAVEGLDAALGADDHPQRRLRRHVAEPEAPVGVCLGVELERGHL